MKKVISILTALVLSLQLTTVFAASYETPTLVVASKEGERGDTVKINVKLDQEDEEATWCNIGFTLNYDQTALKLVAADAKCPGLAVLPSKDGGTFDQNPIVATFTQMENVDFVGTLVTFQFEILSTAKGGEYPLTIDWYKGVAGDYVNGQDVNYLMDKSGVKTPFEVDYVSGAITVNAPVGPTEPTLKATKSGDAVTITAESPDDITGKFIVAGYNGNELVDVVVLNAAAEAKDIKVAGSTVKVMWWDSIEGMTSIAPAVTL